jgi:hypothetical protein
MVVCWLLLIFHIGVGPEQVMAMPLDGDFDNNTEPSCELLLAPNIGSNVRTSGSGCRLGVNQRRVLRQQIRPTTSPRRTVKPRSRTRSKASPFPYGVCSPTCSRGEERRPASGPAARKSTRWRGELRPAHRLSGRPILSIYSLRCPSITTLRQSAPLPDPTRVGLACSAARSWTVPPAKVSNSYPRGNRRLRATNAAVAFPQPPPRRLFAIRIRPDTPASRSRDSHPTTVQPPVRGR